MSLLKKALPYVAAMAVMVALATTVFATLRTIRPVNFKQKAAPLEPFPKVLSAERIQNCLQQRASDMEMASRLSWSDGGTAVGAMDTKAFLRPTIVLSGIISTKGGRLAVVTVDGMAQSAIVREGEDLAGLTILRIDDHSITCLWHGGRFTVPLI